MATQSSPCETKHPAGGRSIRKDMKATSLIALLVVSSVAMAQATLEHHDIRPEQLPKPYASEAADNGSRVVARPAGAELHLPAGFHIAEWSHGGEQRRWMTQAPNGDVFVTDAGAGEVVILRDTKNSGKVDQEMVFAKGLTQPFGIAFHDGYLYVGNTDEVVRFKYRDGQTKAEGAPEKIATLPGHGYNQHWTRNVIFSPDGQKMYVTVGSQSNDSPNEDAMRAAISEYNPDGSGHRMFATGTRNPIGLAFKPGTNELWAAVQERDELGDKLPPDYVTHIQDGGFYGWPYSYIGPNPDPRNGERRPDLVKKTITPDVLLEAHSAVVGLTFYTGKMFPKEYQGDAFAALHGSWNRSQRTGYKIIRIHFVNGKPAGGYDDFVTGWMLSPDKPEVWGRPAGLLVLKDGSLLIADDGGDKIWRVTWGK
jgi:glucose/arabinose dehydrogenase